MPDDAIERRLAAVERALTDGRELPADRAGAARIDDRVEELEATTAELERRIADLDAAVQALRGYVGHVRHVNRTVERRAEAALAAVDGTAADANARPPENSPAEQRPDDSRLDDGRPVEQRPDDSRLDDGRPVEQRPDDSRPDDSVASATGDRERG